VDESLVRDILEVLPPLSDAVHLCNAYVDQGKYGYVDWTISPPLKRATWTYVPDTILYVARSYLMSSSCTFISLGSSFLTRDIPKSWMTVHSRSLTHFQFHHAVSLLYIILAIACLVDPSRPQSIMEAQMYYDLCRVSLTLSPPIREVTLYAVQSLVDFSHTAHFL
jgi:hypothetical protein